MCLRARFAHDLFGIWQINQVFFRVISGVLLGFQPILCGFWEQVLRICYDFKTRFSGVEDLNFGVYLC